MDKLECAAEKAHAGRWSATRKAWSATTRREGVAILGRFDETRATAEKLNKLNPRNVYDNLLLADIKRFAPDDPQIPALEVSRKTRF